MKKIFLLSVMIMSASAAMPTTPPSNPTTIYGVCCSKNPHAYCPPASIPNSNPSFNPCAKHSSFTPYRGVQKFYPPPPPKHYSFHPDVGQSSTTATGIIQVKTRLAGRAQE